MRVNRLLTALSDTLFLAVVALGFLTYTPAVNAVAIPYGGPRLALCLVCTAPDFSQCQQLETVGCSYAGKRIGCKCCSCQLPMGAEGPDCVKDNRYSALSGCSVSC